MNCATGWSKRIRLWLVFSAAVTTIANGAPQQTSPASTSIEGTVVDAVTGRAITGATVAWPPIRTSGLIAGGPIGFKTVREGVQSVSDAEGHFAIENIEAGRFQITASKTGYQSAQLTFSGEPGQRLKASKFSLTPNAIVTGRVVDSRGNPLTDVSLELIRYGYTVAEYYVSDHPQWTLAGHSGSTDDRGEFRITGVAPSRYLVRFRPTAESRVAGVLYPGVADSSRAEFVEVAAGMETRLANVTLMPQQSGPIRVRIANTGTTELPTELALAWFRIGERFPFSDTVDALPLRITPDSVNEIHPDLWGNYMVQATNSRGPITFRATQKVEYSGNTVDVSLRVVRPDARLKGRIMIETPTGDVPYALEGIGSLTLMADVDPFILSVRSGKDGTFTVGNGLSSHYWVNDIRGLPDNYYIVSARQGEKDVLKDGVNLSNTSEEMAVMLSPFGGTVVGSVQGVHDAVVALIPEGKVRERSDRLYTFPSMRTDQNGNFEIHGVIPGSYRAYAWRQIEDGAFRDPEVINKFERKGIPIIVEKSGRVSMDLKLADAPAPPR